MEHLRWILLGVGIIGLSVMYWRWQQQANNGARGRKEPRLGAHKQRRDADQEPDFDDWSLDSDPIGQVEKMKIAEEPKFTAGQGEMADVADLDDNQITQPQTDEVKAGAEASRTSAAEQPEKSATQQTADSNAKHIVVLHIKAKSEQGFTGNDIVRVFTALELEYGEMKIFNRYPGDDRSAGPIFSVANMFEPGVFEREEMSTLVTPGVTLFMQLPGPVDDVVAYDDMVACAQYLATDLNGELLDEARQPFTPAKVERHRDRVMSFTKQRSHSRHV